MRKLKHPSVSAAVLIGSTIIFGQSAFGQPWTGNSIPPGRAAAEIRIAATTNDGQLDQDPPRCLESLLDRSAQTFPERCVVVTPFDDCVETTGLLGQGSHECWGDIKMSILGTPQESPLGTNCFPFGSFSHIRTKQNETEVEAIGRFCLTPNANFVDAAVSCSRTDPSGAAQPALRCIGNLLGTLPGALPNVPAPDRFDGEFNYHLVDIPLR